jgi:hypothetical protein
MAKQKWAHMSLSSLVLSLHNGLFFSPPSPSLYLQYGLKVTYQLFKLTNENASVSVIQVYSLL